MSTLLTWAAKHGVSAAALAELDALMRQQALPENLSPFGNMLEAGVQQQVRFAAAGAGWLLWRNNVGEMEDARGNHVRYGLCNDSKKLNDRIKSSDLIGLRPVTITSQMVGQRIGQFVARECKRADWKYTGTAREEAQLRFIKLVNQLGGDAQFTTGAIDHAVITK